MIREIKTESIPRKAFSDEELRATPETTTIDTKLTMPEAHGIGESQDIRDLILGVEGKVTVALEDGNLSTVEIFSIATTALTHIMPAITGVGEVGNEARNLNRDEIRALTDPVRSRNEGAADIIEGALWVMTGTFKLTGFYIYNQDQTNEPQ